MDSKRIKLSNENGDGGVVNDIKIRTLHVSPVNDDMGEQIMCYFQQFGVVNYVEFEEAVNFSLVQFKTDAAATAVLSSNATHTIGDCDVHVKAAEPWLQPDHILNALDDDCLRLILLELNQSDLTDAANVCVRFNELAKSVFSTKFKKLYVECTFGKAENSLKTFGSLAQSVEITGLKNLFGETDSREIEILQMFTQYCTPELKKLIFHGFNFKSQASDIVFNFDLVLSKLERLVFVDCKLGNTLSELPSACVELKNLRIERSVQDQDIDLPVWPEFSKLEELRLIHCYGLHEKFKHDIISTNSKLLKISVNETYVHHEADASLKMIRAIAQNHPNLLELDFRMEHHTDDFFENFRCLTSLKVLKLALNFNDNSLAVLVKILTANDIPIEHLQLCNEIINTEAVTAILQMKQLTVFELTEVAGLTDEHMIALAKGLGSQLEELRLCGSTAENLTTRALKRMLPFATKLSHLTLKLTTITIDADDYKAMLATVQKRADKTPLSIELTRRDDQISVGETVRMGSGIFTVDEKIDDSSDSDDSGPSTIFVPESDDYEWIG